MLERNHRSDPLPEARTPAVILDRALAGARRQDEPRGWLSEALRELADPRTVLEMFAIPIALAGLVTIIVAAVGG